jgi:nucleotide-binding universal stress UspA family protein
MNVCQLIPPIAEPNSRLLATLAEESCQTMRGALDDHASEWCTAAFHLRHGEAMDDIIERAPSQHVGRIVLGVRRESHLGQHLHTSFAYQLLAKTTCPVLSVPPFAEFRPGPAA